MNYSMRKRTRKLTTPFARQFQAVRVPLVPLAVFSQCGSNPTAEKKSTPHTQFAREE
jgi:hypothetical protein